MHWDQTKNISYRTKPRLKHRHEHKSHVKFNGLKKGCICRINSNFNNPDYVGKIIVIRESTESFSTYEASMVYQISLRFPIDSHQFDVLGHVSTWSRS